MNIITDCTDRKAMAHALAEHLGTTAEYLRTPTYAYRVGNLMVERDGSITGEQADFEAIADWLLDNGYIQEPLTATAQEAIKHTAVTISLTEFTTDTMKNLIRMLYARQHLICKMMQTECIAISDEVLTKDMTGPVLEECIASGQMKGIGIYEDRLTIDFPYDPAEPARWVHFATFLLAIADKAKAATRVNAALIDPEENELKYFCRSFLLQLGLGGAAHKELRAALLNHLPGYAAFRTPAKMDAHRQKYADLRRQLREANSQAQTEEESTDA